VVPNVDSDVAYTFHWIYKRYHELVVGCDRSTETISFSINLGLSMGGLFMCIYNGKSYANGGQWLETHAHIKRVVANRDVEGYIVAMLNIRKNFIRCAWMFRILHPQDMDNHHVDYFYLSINLWVEGSQFGHLGVHHQP
jgi:hypothetical protein